MINFHCLFRVEIFRLSKLRIRLRLNISNWNISKHDSCLYLPASQICLPQEKNDPILLKGTWSLLPIWGQYSLHEIDATVSLRSPSTTGGHHHWLCASIRLAPTLTWGHLCCLPKVTITNQRSILLPPWGHRHLPEGATGASLRSPHLPAGSCCCLPISSPYAAMTAASPPRKKAHLAAMKRMSNSQRSQYLIFLMFYRTIFIKML